MTKITIPYRFTPRDYQLPLLDYLDSGGKRAFCLWHRRCGKDITLFNYTIKQAFLQKGMYFYLLPTYVQAKRVIWQGINNDGDKILDYVPEPIIKNKNETELRVELKNGSIIQLIGTDKYDAIRGTNPVGCVFSEYAFHNPMAWEVIKPILKVNKGWVVFNTTPNGKNHAFDMWEMATKSPEWFTEILTIDNTNVVTPEDIQQEREEGMTEEMIQQEYYCSFDIGAQGSYYSNEMQQANEERRVGKVPFFREKDTNVVFDLGISDMMSVWFWQTDDGRINLTNFYENNNKNLEFYFNYIDDYLAKGKLGTIYVPHDASKRELSTGKSVYSVFQDRYSEKVQMLEMGGTEMGIQAVRRILPRCYFDADNCKQGIRCLENYHREWDEVKKVFKPQPMHDWTSHACFVKGTKIMTTKGLKKIEEIKRGEFVRMDDIVAKIEWAGYVKDSETLIIELNSGEKIECSLEHKFFTNRGVVRANELRYDDHIHTINHPIWNLSHFKNSGIRDGVISYTKGLGSGFGKKENNSVHKKTGDSGSYIGRFGKTSMGKSLTGMRLFPLMGVGTTSTFLIGDCKKRDRNETSHLNMSLESSMDCVTLKKKEDIFITSFIQNICTVLFGSLSMVAFPKPITYITKMKTKAITVLKTWKLFLLRNMRNSMRKQTNGSEVRKTNDSLLKQGEGVGIKRITKGEIQPVYDLTVERDQCYYANGILVSNSDSFRYLAIAYKEERPERVEENDDPLGLFEEEMSGNRFCPF